MVGSVLMERMLAERISRALSPVFFHLPGRAGGPEVIGTVHDRARRPRSRPAVGQDDIIVTCQGGELHPEVLPGAAQQRLEGLLDRCGLHPAHGGGQHHRPRPGQPRGHRPGPGRGHQGLHRRQLHRLPDAHGPGRAVRPGPGGVDDLHDLPGRLRRRRQEHARAGGPDAAGRRRRRRTAGRSGLGHPGPGPQVVETLRATRLSRPTISARRWPPA